MNAALSGSRKASYVLLLLALWAVARWELGPALIAGLFAHMMLVRSEAALAGAKVSTRIARASAVALFVVVGLLLAAIFVAFIRIGLTRLPILLDRLLPRLDAVSGRFGVALPVDNVQELKALIIEALKENARSISSASGLLTRGFFQIVVALVVAILHFLDRTDAAPSHGLDGALMDECRARLTLFAASFDRVMGAQFTIAAINAGVAAAFLIVFRIPFRTMLTLTTFILGVVPIVGNLISNSLIVAAALTRSDNLAVGALVFLVVVHKGGYFLTGRIIGSRTETPTWAILLGLLVGEATLGITGVILAPTLIHYAREELRAVPAR